MKRSIEWTEMTWNPVTGASHYRVYRAETIGGVKTFASDWQSATSLDDRAATPSTTYYYFVRAAIDDSGTHSSGYSDYNKGYRDSASLPWLSIVPEGGTNCIISWSPDDPGWLLQETFSLMTNWWDSASGSINPVTIPATEAAMFYRLRRE